MSNFPHYQYPVPANAPDAGTLHRPEFGADWLPILLDVADNLKRDDIWVNPPDDIEQQVDELVARLMVDVPHTPQVFPETCLHVHGNSLVNNGNAIIFALDTAQAYNGHWRQNPAALGDSFLIPVLLREGIYRLMILGVRNTNCGILKIRSEDTTELAEIDYYGTLIRNYIVEVEIEWRQSEVDTLHCIVNEKNPSSAGYFMELNTLYFERTGDLP